jgi:uncharacterized protein (UPF0264 family)
MKQQGGRASFLASVTDEHEAMACVALGADIIDAKNPAAGALGALPLDTVRAIRAAVPAHVPVSATIGDPCADVQDIVQRAKRMAATGVDIVKVGLDAALAARETVEALGAADLAQARLVAVLLADRGIDLDLVACAGEAGFAGVMLDTAGKASGALPDIIAADTLAAFIAAAHQARLFAGLAGSLRVHHVSRLLALGPDVLGFRGGLCRNGERADVIDADAVRTVRQAIEAPKSSATCGERLLDGMARRQPEDAL